MDCASVSFSGHALRRLFDRALGRDAVPARLHAGVLLSLHSTDHSYPDQWRGEPSPGIG